MTEAADEVSSFEWRGIQYPVSAETIRAALAPVAAAERELSADPAAAAGASGPSDLRLVKLDRLGNAYAGALAAVQSAVANGAPFCTPLAVSALGSSPFGSQPCPLIAAPRRCFLAAHVLLALSLVCRHRGRPCGVEGPGGRHPWRRAGAQHRAQPAAGACGGGAPAAHAAPHRCRHQVKGEHLSSMGCRGQCPALIAVICTWSQQLISATLNRNIGADGVQPTRQLFCIARTQDKERPGKPEDVVRLYDGMAVFAADLGDLAADVGGAAGEALIDRASAQARAGVMRAWSLLASATQSVGMNDEC